MKHLFQKINIKKPSFFEKISGKSNAETVIQEINNLLAERDITDIERTHIVEILNKNKQVEDKLYFERVLEFYSICLVYAIEDGIITEQESKELLHLKNILCISDADIGKVQSQVVGTLYRSKYKDVIADGEITEEERNILESLTNQLSLSKKLQESISAEVRTEFVQKFLVEMASDQRLSPDEVEQFERIKNNLNVQIEIDNATSEILDRYKLYWIIENGLLPTITVEIKLKQGEVCYYRENASIHELRTVTKSVVASGPSLSFKITKGVRYRVSNLSSHRISSEQLVIVDSGSVYLTNQRIIFQGSSKNESISFSEILSLTPYSNGIEIAKEKGKNKYIITRNNADILALMAARLLEEF